MYQPTIEYMNRLPGIAAKTYKAREDRIRQNSRSLNIRLAEQKRLNQQAIKAKLTGELAPEDFDALKASVTEETAKIEEQLNALESERKMLEEMTQQAKLENVSFVKAWKAAGIQGRLELQKAMFPDGLVWSHETGFLNRQNTTFMDGLQQLFQSLGDSEAEPEKLLVKFGVPDGI